MEEATAEVALTQDNLKQKNNILLYISLAKDTLGKIRYCSGNIMSLIGFSNKEMVGKALDTFFPTHVCFQDKLNRALSIFNEFHDSPLEILGINSCYLRAKDGYSIPCEVHISVYPYHSAEPLLACIVRCQRTKVNRDSLIINSEGFVDCWTKHFGMSIGLDKIFLSKKNKIQLSSLSKESDKILAHIQSEDLAFS